MYHFLSLNVVLTLCSNFHSIVTHMCSTNFVIEYMSDCLIQSCSLCDRVALARSWSHWVHLNLNKFGPLIPFHTYNQMHHEKLYRRFLDLSVLVPQTTSVLPRHFSLGQIVPDNKSKLCLCQSVSSKHACILTDRFINN